MPDIVKLIAEAERLHDEAAGTCGMDSPALATMHEVRAIAAELRVLRVLLTGDIGEDEPQ